MPCSAPARGIRNTPPHTQAVPFNDLVDNNPCGRRIISTANGVSFAADSLCLFHLHGKLGTRGIEPPYVEAA